MDQTGAERIRGLLSKYGYVILILFTGILLMLLPAPSKASAPAPETAEKAEVMLLQDQLSILLSQVEGAGKVNVLLTIASSEKMVYQNDSDSTRTSTVILTDSSRNQAGLICRVDSPQYLGAVVVCQGADRAAVRLSITQAISNATGLSYDKITILKMK